MRLILTIERYMVTIMVIPHTAKVNVGLRLYFELTESFGIILYEVHRCNCCTIF